MAYSDVLPFALGTTFGGGATLTSANATDGEYLLGTRYQASDPSRYGSQPIIVEVVRNSATVNLLPKDVVQYAAGKWGREVDQRTRLDAADPAGVVDERLPSAGVPQYDLFYIVVGGYTRVKRKKSGNYAANIAQGAKVVALTAATTGASDAGAFGTQTTAVTQDVLINNAVNVIGRLVDTSVSTDTATDPVVCVTIVNRP